MNQGFCTAYMQNLEPEKLLQLRAKTDRQLLDFAHSRLEAGLNSAALAATLYSSGNCESAERSLECGKQVLNEVESLLPAMTEEQRRDLDPKIERLRETIGLLSALYESPKTQTATSVW